MPRRYAPALFACISLTALALACAAAQPHAPAAKPHPVDAAEASPELIGGALADGVAFQRLAELTDGIGPRLSGSPGAAAAIAWAQQRFQEDGIAVHTEPVTVPHWVRGIERGEIVSPAQVGPIRLALTALGGSAATPEGGLTAEVIEARSLAELATLGEKVRGKIVLFQHTMTTAQGYGEFGSLRSKGPLAAAGLGAAAALVRSLATASFRSPHTGMMATDAAVPNIPGAALSTEDAELVHRLLERGPVRIHLELGCQTLPDVQSANVVAEIRGREKPDEIVLIGAHLDSWDLATGAIDDGAGVAMVMESMRLIGHLRTHPRRTIRAVLFINEENGLAGGKAYAAAHAPEIGKHVAAMECDIGAGGPISFSVHSGPGGADLLRPRFTPLSTLGCSGVEPGDRAGSDISPLQKVAEAPPVLELIQDTVHYFDVHHSAADTLDKVQPRALAESTAAFAWATWTVAEMEETLPRPVPSKDE